MMIEVIYYDIDTGEISRRMMLPDADAILINKRGHESFSFDQITSFENSYVSPSGRVELRPSPPAKDERVVWDRRNKVWLDRRPTAEADADKAKARAERRASAEVTRSALILALVAGGHVPEAEAVGMARGEITEAVSGLSFEDRVIFAGAVTFRRNDAIVNKLRTVLKMTPEEMDAAFDIALT